jgi:hypothetical protein
MHYFYFRIKRNQITIGNTRKEWALTLPYKTPLQVSHFFEEVSCSFYLCLKKNKKAEPFDPILGAGQILT